MLTFDCNLNCKYSMRFILFLRTFMRTWTILIFIFILHVYVLSCCFNVLNKCIYALILVYRLHVVLCEFLCIYLLPFMTSICISFYMFDVIVSQEHCRKCYAIKCSLKCWIRIEVTLLRSISNMVQYGYPVITIHKIDPSTKMGWHISTAP